MADPLDETALESLIRTRPDDVDRAFIEVGPPGRRIGLAELAFVFRASPVDDPAAFAHSAIAHLAYCDLLGRFSAILAAENMDKELAEQRANMSVDAKIGRWIYGRGLTARCGIFRGASFVGSGCIVGPSLILTSAHVLGAANENGGYDAISIMLYNNERIAVEAKPVFCSLPADADSVLPLAEADAAFAGFNDVALLRTRMPVGSDPCLVELPANDWAPTHRAALMLYHFPQGTEEGVGNCTLDTFHRPSVRWAYTSPAEPGSSGGACLNVAGKLIGVHQGRRNTSAPRSRLVPLSAPIDDKGVGRTLREMIAREVDKDVRPEYIWSLDGRMEGVVVLGRTDLFKAFAHLGRPDATYRALRIRREDPDVGTDGLGYSVQLVRSLVDRQSRQHRSLLLSWPQPCHDAFDPVARLANEAHAAGLVGRAAGGEAAGIGTGETGIATVLRGKVEGLLSEIHRSAEQRDEMVWLVIEHADGEIAREHAIAMETIASLAPRWSQLRLILIGNETVSPFLSEERVNVAGQNPAPQQALVEYLGPIWRRDVEEFIGNVRRLRDGVAEIDSVQLGNDVERVLKGLSTVGGRHPLAQMPEIVARLRGLLG